MSKLMSLFAALRYGSSLADPAIHKNRQNLVNALVGLFGALVVWAPIEIASDDIINIAGGIASLIGLYNIYITTASTKQIGLPSNSGSIDPTVRRDVPQSSGSIVDPDHLP